LLFEQLWIQVRQGLAVVSWVVLAGLVAAASCWCCGYVVRADLLGRCPPARRRRSAAVPLPDAVPLADTVTLPDAGRTPAAVHRQADAAIADEAARGIRDIERYLSTV
jgi:hypothetical protein